MALERSGERATGQSRSIGPPAHRRARERQRSEEHTSELQSQFHLVCRLLLEKKKKKLNITLLTILRIPRAPALTYCFASAFHCPKSNASSSLSTSSRHTTPPRAYHYPTFFIP